MVHGNDFVPLLINETSRAHLDDSLACFGRVLRLEHLIEFFQGAIFRLDEEEIYYSV